LSEILWKHCKAHPTGTTGLPLFLYTQKGATRELIALDKQVTDIPVNAANQRVVYLSGADANPTSGLGEMRKIATPDSASPSAGASGAMSGAKKHSSGKSR
jgi:hypothetical protein